MRKNIDVSGPDFAPRMRRLRGRVDLTPHDLAEQSGVSYRTIIDLENGRRPAAQEKTLRVIARSLGVPLEILVDGALEPAAGVGSSTRPTSETRASDGRSESAPRGGDDTPPHDATASAHTSNGGSRRSANATNRRLFVVLVSFAAVVLAGMGLYRLARVRAQVYTDLHSIGARDGFLGITLWHHDLDGRIRYAFAPREEGYRVVYGLSLGGIETSELFVREVPTGTLLWSIRLGSSEIASAFGREMADDGGFLLGDVKFADTDGDGRHEIVAYFYHDRWYPACLVILDDDGTREGCYHNFGHLYDIQPADIDGDGIDEIVAAGTNNVHNGATVILLDPPYLGGTSVDSPPGDSGGPADSCAVRLVLPPMSTRFMVRFGTSRLQAGNIALFRTTRGEMRLHVDVRVSTAGVVVVTLDRALHPLHADISDGVVRDIESWPPEDRAAFVGGYLGEWLESAKRYGVLASRP